MLSRLRAGILPGPRGWLRPLDEPGSLMPYRVDRRRLFMVEGNILAGVGLIAGAITEPTLPWLISALLAIVMLTTAGLLTAG